MIRNLAKKMGYPHFPDMQSRCEKVLEHIEKANKVANSRMTSIIQSYDHRDNGQYRAMLALEEVLQKPEDEDAEEQPADEAMEQLYGVLKDVFKKVSKENAEERAADQDAESHSTEPGN